MYTNTENPGGITQRSRSQSQRVPKLWLPSMSQFHDGTSHCADHPPTTDEEPSKSRPAVQVFVGHVFGVAEPESRSKLMAERAPVGRFVARDRRTGRESNVQSVGPGTPEERHVLASGHAEV